LHVINFLTLASSHHKSTQLACIVGKRDSRMEVWDTSRIPNTVVRQAYPPVDACGSPPPA
jgi:hypothetical protein